MDKVTEELTDIDERGIVDISSKIDETVFQAA